PQVLAALLAIQVPGEDRADAAAGEPLVQTEERIGDLAVRPRHRLGGAGADQPVACAQRTEPALREQGRVHRAGAPHATGWWSAAAASSPRISGRRHERTPGIVQYGAGTISSS